MPVDEVPVHPKTVGKQIYEACQAKIRKPGYYAPDRQYFPDGSFRAISTYVPDTSSTGCRSDRKIAPEMCFGCQFPADHDYLNRMGISL